MMNQESGFTIVEMIVTLVVGALLIGVFNQLFVSVVRYGADSRRDAAAYNIADSLIKKYKSTTDISGGAHCVENTSVINGSGSLAALGTYTQNVSATCPYSESPAITLVTATVTYSYGGTSRSVKQALYVN